MKNKFKWYYRASEEEIAEAWKNGILTVDTNVLLDLYRYNENTRNSLLSSLKRFEGKKWITFQACQEFFRNRTKVIISSEKTFNQAKDEVVKLQGNLDSTVSQLKGNRIIPANVAEDLLNAILPAIATAQEKIQETKEGHPNFLREDPILNEVTELFSGSVGEDFKSDEIEKIKEEAEQRKKNKVPPGYLDEDKEADRPYGDFFLWKQIIEHAKAQGLPIIFVTSERKEDWWEKIAGKTTGPRPELLKEAFECSGQRILIYQTDQFLEFSLQRFGQKVDESAVEEIRSVDTLRSETEGTVKLRSQSVEENSESKNVGTLSLDLRRAVKSFTVSGHFTPNLKSSPTLKTRLQSAPPGMPHFKIGAGTGTNFDFNVHISSFGYGTSLPVGPYIIEYEAICDEVEPDASEEAEATEI